MTVRTVLIIVVVTSLLIIVLDRLITTVWIGGFDLSVKLQGPGVGHLNKVNAATIRSAEEFEDHPFLHEVADFTNPFLVTVPTSGRVSGLGRELAYHQFRFLMLRLEFPGYEPEFRLVNIPNHARKINVIIDPPSRLR
jgi:hypothetical protein